MAEAASLHSDAGNGTEQLVSNTNPNVKKIFRARKTMTASCRQQMAIINKIKASKKESTSSGPYALFPKEQMQQPDITNKVNCFAQGESASKENKSLELEKQDLFPKELQVSIEVSQVDAEIDIVGSKNETFSQSNSIEKNPEDVSTSPVTPLNNPLYLPHNHSEISEPKNTLLDSPTDDEHLKQANSPPSNGNQLAEEKCMQLSPIPQTVQDFTEECSQPNPVEVPVSEEHNEPLQKNLNEDLPLDQSIDLGFGTSPKPSDVVLNKEHAEEEFTGAVCTTGFQSSSPNGFALNVSDNNSKDPPNTFESVAGAGERKRSRSESDEIANCKRIKPSGTAWPEPEKVKVALEKIQCLIESRIQIFFKETFDQRVEDLTQQVNLIHCRRSHGDDIARHLKKVKKLEGRIKTLLSIQKEATRSRQSHSVSMHCDKTAASTTDTNLSTIKKLACVEDPHFGTTNSVNPHSRTGYIVPSDKCDNHKSTPYAVLQPSDTLGLPVVPKSEESSQVKRTDYPKEAKKLETVIDLTADEEQKCSTADVKMEEQCPSTPALSDKNQEPALATLLPQKSFEKDERTLQEPKLEAPSSFEEGDKQFSPKTVKTQNIRSETVIDLTAEDEQKCDKESTRKCSSLTQNTPVQSDNILEPTKTTLLSQKSLEEDGEGTLLKPKPDVPTSCEQPEKQSSSKTLKAQKNSPVNNTEKQKPAPPQKPELRLTQVQNPSGIALSWTISKVDPNCAPAESYCLYVHQEDPKIKKVLWKKIGEIKALPLPMACTLTQFVEGATYCFALRAKDEYGRFGPLCDIQSATLAPTTNPSTNT